MTEIQLLQNKISRFVNDRDWNKYHNSKNLSMAIACEAAELMELFRWETEGEVPFTPIGDEQVRDEVADIAIFLLSFCNHHGIDLADAIKKKIKKNALKYPVIE